MIGAHRGKYPIFTVLGAASSAHAGKYPILTDFKTPLLYPHFGSGGYGFSVFAQISRHKRDGPAIPQWDFVEARFLGLPKKVFQTAGAGATFVIFQNRRCRCLCLLQIKPPVPVPLSSLFKTAGVGARGCN